MVAINDVLQSAERSVTAIQSITSSIDVMAIRLDGILPIADRAADPSPFQGMQVAVLSAAASLTQYREEMEQIRNLPIPTSPPPSPTALPSPPESPPDWIGNGVPEVSMKSGASRFEFEAQAAIETAQELYEAQQKITNRAQNMSVVPVGMLNDMASMSNRVQRISLRLEELNSLPIHLRTDQVNNEIETLRGRLSQVANAQDSLSSAISRMDIGAANSAYSQLDLAVSETERGVRDNVMAQQNFNEEIAKGTGAFEGLSAKISGIVSSLQLGDTIKTIATQMYQSAIQLEATQARYNAAFSGMTNESDQFIKEFQRLTPTTTAEARTMAAGIQELLVPMGMQKSQATAMTGEMMYLIGALANYNSATKSASDVSGAFESAISGDYGSLKELGIQVDEAIVKQQAVAMGLASTTDSVGSAAQAQALLAIAQQQSGDALGMYNEKSLSTAARMEILQKSFQDAFGAAGQTLLPRINELLSRVQDYMPQISAGLDGFSRIFGGVIELATEAFTMVMEVGGVIAENWSWLAPIIAGVTAAILLYNLALGAGNLVMGISNGLKILSAMWAVAHGTATVGETVATVGMTASQLALNAALLACPLTWIVLAIVILIAAVFAIVAAINQFAGTSISAVGVVAAIFGVLWTHINNTFLIPFWNNIVAFINFFYNVWNEPIASIRILFFDLASTIIGRVLTMAQAIEEVINKIPGVEVNLTAGLEGFQKQIKDAAQEAKDASEWKEIVKPKEFKHYSDEASKWYNQGKGAEDTFTSLFEKKEPKVPEDGVVPDLPGAGDNAASNIAANTGGTAANTAAIADSMDLMEEDLKYMRDAAEQEIINRFTLAQLKVDVKNNNTLSKKTDFDDMGRFLSSFTSEFLAASAEGGHL